MLNNYNNNSSSINYNNKILHKKDNSFIIYKNNAPYHITKNMNVEYNDILKLYNENNSIFEEEKTKEFNLSELKQIKLNNLKQQLEKKFYSNYPLYKQNNIAIFGTNEEKQQFKSFHDKITKEYDEKVEIIKNIKTIDDLYF